MPYRIVFLGSSTTVHGGASGPEYGYVTQVIRAFQAEYPSGITGLEAAAQLLSAIPDHGPGIKPYNGGIAGTTAATYLPQASLDGIAVLDPSLFIHTVGSNDWASNVPIASYEASVRAAITAIDARTTRPCVHVLVHAFPRRDVTHALHSWAEYGAALKQIADNDPAGRIFIDASLPYLDSGLPANDPYGLIGPDNIHGTDRSHALLAAQITDVLLPPGTRYAPIGAEILAFDRFNRADGAVGNSELGGNWSTAAGRWEISNQKVIAAAAGVLSLPLGRPNVAVAATITRPMSGTVGVACRINGSTDRLAWYFNGASGVQLACVTATGGIELLGGAATVPFAVHVGKTARLRLEARNDNVRAYINDVLSASATLTTKQMTALAGAGTGLRAGADFTATGTTFDDVLVVAV